MTRLSKGANAPVPGSLATVRVTAPEPVDLSAVLLSADGRVRSDRDLVFFNQPTAPGVALDVHASALTVDFSAVERDVQTIGLVLSLDGSRSTAFGTLGDRINLATQSEGAVLEFRPSGLTTESALLAIEFYRRSDAWKLRAVAQGWDDGLAGLARSFGVVVDDEPAPTATTTPSQVPAPAPHPRSPAIPASTQATAPRVELTKRGDARSIDLVKHDGKRPLRFNLDWRHGTRGPVTDLDLGCFVEMADGGKMVIQPLGQAFGYVRKWPWIKLDQDDRTGASKNGENLTIHRPGDIERVLVFAMVYAGQGFRDVEAALTINDGEWMTLVRLDNPTPRKTWCAIAMVTRHSGSVEIRKEELYFSGHAQADKHYGFGFNWVPGRKR